MIADVGVDRAVIDRPIVRGTVAVLGLAVLLAANYFLRHTLERSHTYIYSFFNYFYAAAEKQVFAADYPRWKLFLPIPALSGTWTTTTLILTHLVEMRLTPPVTWEVYNLLLMIVSFVTSWVVFRSLVFGFTFVICMGFGTQLYHSYAVAGPMALCLLLIYYEVLLLCGLRVIQGAPRVAAWRAAFIVVVIVTAIAYEGWLDFLVFSWLAAALLFSASWRFGKKAWRPGLAFSTTCLSLVGVAYLYIKTHAGFAQTHGSESDVVFNYPMLAPKIEDTISNVLTHFYVVVTNFLPPALVSSTAFYELGGDKLVELQRDRFGVEYHAPFTYLVPMQYLFLWRFYAGASFVVFCYAVVRVLRRTFAGWSPDYLAAAIFLFMIATGGPTHDFVKARPMNSMPVLGYHVLVGVLGLSLLLSWLAMLAVTRLRHRWLGAATVAALWAVIFYSALTRPAMLSHQAAQVGLGEALYPDPKATLAAMFGVQSRPAGGAAIYQLMKHGPPSAAAAVPATAPSAPAPAATPAPAPVPPPPAPVHFGTTLAPLPNVLSLRRWTSFPGVTGAPINNGYRVSGNATPTGYQVISEPLAVLPHHRVLVRVAGTIEEGRVCFGALDESQQHWLLPANGSQQEYTASTGNNTHLWLLFANCFTGKDPPVATRFVIESISYGILQNAEDHRR
jgi:hypothetical protein